MFAGVPCYHLKQLHQTVKEDMPQPRTLLMSWQEMRNVYRQQQYEPEYAFDTPVPPQRYRKKKNQEEALESSIGDLAPFTIA